MLNDARICTCSARPNTVGYVNHGFGCPLGCDIDVKIDSFEFVPAGVPKISVPSGPVGWRCPNCGAGLSPYTAVCPCTPAMRPTLTSTGTGLLKVGSPGS